MPSITIGPPPDFVLRRDKVSILHHSVVSIKNPPDGEPREIHFTSPSLFKLARQARQIVDGCTKNMTPKIEWMIGLELKAVIDLPLAQIMLLAKVPVDLGADGRNLIFHNFVNFFESF